MKSVENKMSKYQKVHGSKGPMNFVEPSLVETLQFLVLSFASSMERWVNTPCLDEIMHSDRF